MLAMATTEMSARNLVVITQSVEKRSDCSQWICDEAGNVIQTHEHAGDFKVETDCASSSRGVVFVFLEDWGLSFAGGF
jgi:hypothetical protein